jgi:hypothetical protein
VQLSGARDVVLAAERTVAHLQRVEIALELRVLDLQCAVRSGAVLDVRVVLRRQR